MARQEQRPILTVDVILFTVQNNTLCAALQHRNSQPFTGQLALIGGYIHTDEDFDTKATAERVLREKAGLEKVFIEQLMTISGSTRDPRGWSASVIYYALMPEASLAPVLEKNISIVPVNEIPALPFDHNEIIENGLERLRNKGAYSSMPIFLLGEYFTMPELRKIYEIVMGTTLNDSAFRRKIEELQIIELIPGAFKKTTDRPAKLYRLKKSALQEFNRKI